MPFIPSVIFYGHSTIIANFYIRKSLILTLIDNISEVGLLIALPCWYLYLW